MKKWKVFLTLLLAVFTSASSFPATVSAEENADELYYEEDGGEDYSEDSPESETEHVEAYYAEIQSNNIAGWPQGDAVNADSAILIDGNTGAVLYAKDVEKKEYPASITKIMTTLIALEKGNLSDVVTFSENAVYSIEFGSSHLGLTEGEQLTLEQCLYGIMMASANEISNAVAEHIGGSIDEYVKMMNERAAQIGCTNTHFVNVHGLHEEDHYVCAKDMALIMKEAMKNEKFREIIQTVEYDYPETNKVKEKRYFMNHHKMLFEEGMVYDGCLGGKTGYTDEAWNTLVTAAERDGQFLIAVVLRSPGLYVSYEDTKVLLDYGFEHFRDEKITNCNSADMEITGIDDTEELAKIKAADILQAPFSMVGSTQVTLPEGVTAENLKKKMDFGTKQMVYSYEGQVLGSVGFSYTGEWEVPTESTETETESDESEIAGIKESAGQDSQDGNVFVSVLTNGLSKAGEGIGYAYGKMDTFIRENTMIAVGIGAVLLLIFVPILIVSVIRNRKYHKMMLLREEEMRMRRLLEEELEKKSAAQVEAELRAEEFRARLEEEQKRRRQEEKELQELENSEEFYLDEEPGEDIPAKNKSEKEKINIPEEDEYIEVDPDDIDMQQGLF
ncbi:MAG: hypothetical protein Q4F83_10670 [Eubacteriales bacterium]|nr:hypothetical protein [Eubacteriales bacterium]